MDARDIVKAAKMGREGYYHDLIGLGTRIHPGLPDEDAARFAAACLLEYEHLRHELSDGNSGWPGYTGPSPSEFLAGAKRFMRVWAARKHEGSPNANWYRMQDEFARELFLREYADAA